MQEDVGDREEDADRDPDEAWINEAPARGWKLLLTGLAFWAYGFRQIKVKVGIEGYDDVKRLTKLRRYVGKNMDLRIDANEAWKASEVVDRQ